MEINFVVQAIIAAITGFGLYKKADVFGLFIKGANEGIKSAFTILPSLCFLMTAVGMLRESGILECITGFIAPAAETLNLYIYRITFRRTPNYGFSTAVSLFSATINMVLLVTANKLSEKFGGTGLMGGAMK